MDYNEEVAVIVRENGEPVGYEIHESARFDAPEGEVVIEDDYQVIEGRRGQQTEVYTHVETYVDEGYNGQGIVTEITEETRYTGVPIYSEAPRIDYRPTIGYTASEVVGGATGITDSYNYKGTGSIDSTLVGSYNAYPVSSSYDPLSSGGNYGATTYTTTSSYRDPSPGTYGATSVESSSYAPVSSSYPSYQPEYKSNSGAVYTTGTTIGETSSSGLDYGTTGAYNTYTSGSSTTKYDVSNLTYSSGKYDISGGITGGVTGGISSGITGGVTGLAGITGLTDIAGISGSSELGSSEIRITGVSTTSSLGSSGLMTSGLSSSLGLAGISTSGLSGSGLIGTSISKPYEYTSLDLNSPVSVSYPAASTTSYSSSSYGAASSTSSYSSPTYEALKAEYSTPSYSGLATGLGTSDLGTGVSSTSYTSYSSGQILSTGSGYREYGL